ncbi:hypothetical protein [Ensifer canadensis]
MFYRGYGYYHQQHMKNLSSFGAERSVEPAVVKSACDKSTPGLWMFASLVAVIGVVILGTILMLSIGPQA